MNYPFLSSINIIKYLLIGIPLFLCSGWSLAQTPQDTTVNNKPIAINADNQQIDLANNTTTFTGNVTITQDGLKVLADKVVITEVQSKNKQIITAYGDPTYFEQISDNAPESNMQGQANQLVYSVEKNSVMLIGKAKLLQQDNQILSDNIVYDINNKIIQADANKGNQVKTKLIPNQVKEIKQ